MNAWCYRHRREKGTNVSAIFGNSCDTGLVTDVHTCTTKSHTPTKFYMHENWPIGHDTNNSRGIYIMWPNTKSCIRTGPELIWQSWQRETNIAIKFKIFKSGLATLLF